MKKPANKTGYQPAAEQVEQRTSAKGKPPNRPEVATQCVTGSEDGLARVRAAARRDRTLRFNNLLHHLSIDRLWKAYDGLHKQAMPGVDGVDWYRYGEDLIANLIELHERLHTGRYRAQPVKRIWIAKPDGGQRPLGITCLEDKIVQQALVWVLESIYEQDFLGFSYGFRPRRSPHNALDALYMALTVKKVSHVFDADIQGYYDHIDQTWLMRFLEHRIADRRILGLIEQTVQAGLIEDDQWQPSQQGIPQGAVLSPLLSNLYLHYALDQWAHQWRGRQARGEVYLIRYADDLVACFQYRRDGQAFHWALAQRLKRFGLNLHPGKTRLIEFGRFARENRAKRGEGKPESFNFLGFTHVCAQRRSDGGYTVRRLTIAKRQREKLKAIRRWLMRHRHLPVAMQGKRLSRVISGTLNYYSVPGNLRALAAFRTEVCKAWLHALRRRSQKAAKLSWDTFKHLVREWIPFIRVIHPYPNERLRV